MSFENRYRIDVIPNGVDSDRFKRNDEKRRQHEGVNILFVSRLIEGKGLQYIIPNMQDIHDKTGARLIIVGDGPYRQELENLTDRYGVRESVSFEGRKTGDDLYEYYNDADLFILPSLSEGMPNVVLEAMSMGLPVIMTPCGGAHELIDGNGIISEIDDFCGNIMKLCADKTLRERFGEVSRSRVIEFFGWRSKALAYLESVSDSR